MPNVRPPRDRIIDKPLNWPRHAILTLGLLAPAALGGCGYTLEQTSRIDARDQALAAAETRERSLQEQVSKLEAHHHMARRTLKAERRIARRALRAERRKTRLALEAERHASEAARVADRQRELTTLHEQVARERLDAASAAESESQQESGRSRP
jgi:hypothetical protein